MRSHRCLAAVSVATALTGAACATARQALRLRELQFAPFYYSYGRQPSPDSATVAHLPAGLDESYRKWGPRTSAVDSLLAGMNALLDSAGWTRRLASMTGPPTEGPTVFIGSAEGFYAPVLNFDWQSRGIPGEHPPFVVHVLRPSQRWRAALSEAAAGMRATHVVVVALGLSDYFMFQTRQGFRPRFEVELGTGYAMELTGLQAMERPVVVLHLVGALLAADGRVIRVGAEGIIAKRPSLVLSVLGAERSLTAQDIEHVLSDRRRDDLTGRPLAWRVALQNLIAQLLRAEERIVR